MYTKEQVLAAIKRTAKAAGGVAPGWRVFTKETGIRYTDWHGRYWTRWSDALAEAGFAPRVLNPRIPDDELLQRFAELARSIGRIPSFSDLRLLRRNDPTIADPKVYARFGGKAALVERLRDWCRARDSFTDVGALVPEVLEAADDDDEPGSSRQQPVIGQVYLIRSGRHYKIGRSNAAGRREREIALQLPERATRVHTIDTDDPPGIEAYWHQRFAAKRLNGEWFSLTADDVRAFKRRRFQ